MATESVVFKKLKLGINSNLRFCKKNMTPKIYVSTVEIDSKFSSSKKQYLNFSSQLIYFN